MESNVELCFQQSAYYRGVGDFHIRNLYAYPLAEKRLLRREGHIGNRSRRSRSDDDRFYRSFPNSLLLCNSETDAC